MSRSKGNSRRKGSSFPEAIALPKETPFFRPFAVFAREKRASITKALPKPLVRSATPSSSPTVAPAVNELATFAQLFYGVEPIKPSLKHPTRSTAAHEAAALEQGLRDDNAVRRHLRSLIEGNGPGCFEVVDDGTRVEGHRTHVDASVLRRLRRGLFSIDDVLDLHGLTVTESREAMNAFLQRASARGERMVLVIHGKGAHSPGGQGVLRGEVAAWLSHGILNAHVAAFSTAVLEDGGNGAMYVLLRREKELAFRQHA